MTLRVYVDDTKVRKRDSQRELLEAVPVLCDGLAQMFEAVGPEASLGEKGKSLVLVGSSWLRARLAAKCRHRKIPLNTAASYLGVDMAFGGARRHTRASKRAVEARRRATLGIQR